jgi:uncharacterized protein with FMN-binding domain
MRRIVTILLSTITMLVLLFSYHTSTNSGAVASSPFMQQPASAGAGSSNNGSSNNGSSSSGSGTATYAGAVADTRWGPVQVEITVQDGRITASRAVQYPQSNSRDVMINSYALPILGQEVVQQQSASIDTISGATVTSDGYLQSLQSAIDQAHL